MTIILGVSCFFHDSSAVLLKDGMLVAAAAEERFSRIKHDSGFPAKAVDFCLERAGIPASAIDHVIFYEKPFLKLERILFTAFETFPQSSRVFREFVVAWMKDKLWIREYLQRHTGVPFDRIQFCSHHVSHAASSFYCSPFDEAAVMTVDGVGEWATTTIGYGRGNKLSLEREIRFPDSIGLLYSVFTAFLGFEVNEGEYKVMGMASYGTPRYMDKVRSLLDESGDGAFALRKEYFSYQYSTEYSFSKKFIELFGHPRPPGDADAIDGYYADIAASIQAVTEELLIKLCRELYRVHPVPRVCLAGGVALNCVANKRLLEETDFKEIYVQPSAGDGGGALGAALYFHHHVQDNPRRFVMEHAYWGSSYDDASIRATLETRGIAYRQYPDLDQLLADAARRLAEGKVIGWFQGEAEWGPRALGNRSILADPRNPDMKDIINRKIKFREPFRPFAPAVLYEQAPDYFELGDDVRQYPYRFMLYVSKVRSEKRNVIPAVTHVDGSARPQVVRKDANERFYRLIETFAGQTGVPVLINTSFNLKGEPIVDTPENALSTFARSGLDTLVMGNILIDKQSQEST